MTPVTRAAALSLILSFLWDNLFQSLSVHPKMENYDTVYSHVVPKPGKSHGNISKSPWSCDVIKVETDLYFHIVMNIIIIIEKENHVGRDLIKSIGCWLDGGSSESELTVDCKKGAEFKWTNVIYVTKEKFEWIELWLWLTLQDQIKKERQLWLIYNNTK